MRASPRATSAARSAPRCPTCIAAVQGRRLRPDHRRDLGHRPGRRGDRAAGRRADVRDDARVRRREPAREDRHARLRRVRRDQQVRPQGRGRCAARRRQAGAAQQRGLGKQRRTQMPVFGTMASRFNDDGVTALYQALQPRLRRARPAAAATAALPLVAHAPQHQPDADRAGRARALPGRDRRHGARLQAARARAGRARARDPAAARSGAHAARRQARTRTAPSKPRSTSPAKREAQLDADARKLLAQWPRHAEGLRRRRVRGEDPRQGNPHRARRTRSLSGTQDPQGRAAAATRTTARS